MRLRSNNTTIIRVFMSHQCRNNKMREYFIEFVFNNESIYDRHYIYVYAASEEEARRCWKK